MTCSKIPTDRLHDFIDKELSNDQTRAIERHLASCEECKRHETELRTLAARLAGLSQTAEPTRDLWPAISTQIAEPDAFLTSLSEALAQRRITDASKLIRGAIHEIVILDPLHKNAAVLLGYFTLWMEMGAAHSPVMPYQSYLALAKECLQRFPRAPRPNLKQLHSVHLHIVEGVIAMHGEEYDEARDHFEFAQCLLKKEITNQDLMAFVTGAIGRALTKKGMYREARKFVHNAIETAHNAGRKETAAALAVMKAWIMFQQNESTEATKTLAEAEVVLQDSDDNLTLANIKAAMGRIARRNGRYAEALKLYETAVDYYNKCDCDTPHPNLARAFANMAFLKRLIAQRICNGRNRVCQDVAVEEPNERVTTLESVQKLRMEARQYLNQAAVIYKRDQDYRGRGSVLLISAMLHIDDLGFDIASLELEHAYALGQQKSDSILMARTRIVQCTLENSRADTAADSIACHSHAEKAHSFAAEAVSLALKTHHNRLTAHAYIWLGIMHLNFHFFDPRNASECYRNAQEFLKSHDIDNCLPDIEGHDYVWEELKLLARKLERTSNGSQASNDSGVYAFHSELDS